MLEKNLFLFRDDHNTNIDFSIIESGEKNDSWERNEKIAIFENDFDICNSTCIIKITVTYEGIPVKGTSDIELN